MAMPSAYATRYRGRRVPATVEMEAKNNAMVEDEVHMRREDWEDAQISEEEVSDSDSDSDDRVEAARRRARARARTRHRGGRSSSGKGGAHQHHRHHVVFHPVVTGKESDSDEDPEYATAKALVMQGRGPGPPPGWASPVAALSAAIPELHDLDDDAGGGDGAPSMYHNVHIPRRQFYPIGAKHVPPAHPLYHAVKPPGHRSAAARASAVSDDGKRNTWTADEDNILASLVAKYGPKKWGIIASYLPGRNAKQCHQRWHYVLTPQISRDTWTPREDYIIFHLHRILGNKWSHIAKHLPGRTGYAVRNRQAFLAKHFKGKPHGPKAPPDMAQHEFDAIREAAATAGSEAPKASSRANRKVKTEGSGGLITERLRLEIPVAVEAHLRSPEEMLAKAVPAGAAPHAHTHPHHQPHHWASDPPRSPLDLLASLPQIDTSAAPYSHHQQHCPTSPVVTPRTQHWFETHFPSLGSPLPSSSHHQPLPTYAPPSAATPSGAAPSSSSSSSSVNLRFPVDAGFGTGGSYWIPSSVHPGECTGEGTGFARDPLRLRHFGSLGEKFSPHPSPRDVYLYQQAMAEHQKRHPEHEQGKGWTAEALSESQEGAASADVGARGHHFQQPLFNLHSFLTERTADAEGREEQGGGAHGLHHEQYRTDREAGPGPASGISTLAMTLGLAGPSPSKGEVPPTPSPTTTIGAPRASPFHQEVEVDAATDSKLPALSAATKGVGEGGEQEWREEQREGGKVEKGIRSPISPTEDEMEENEVEENEETQDPGSSGMVCEIGEDRGDHYRVKRPKL